MNKNNPDLIGDFGVIYIINEQLCVAEITDELARKRLKVKPSVSFPLSDLSTWIERLRITHTGNGGLSLSGW